MSADLSLIPIKPDGTKQPYFDLLPYDDLTKKRVWKRYQSEKPSHQDLIRWFTPDTGAGIAIIGGAISGNLEILDFDVFDLYDLWCALVKDVAPGLLEKLTLLIATPRPGRHVPYRCDRIEGNQELAHDENGKVLIETRGDGGFIVAAGSPLACHPSGRPYEVLKGSWEAIPTITPNERDILLGLARSFNRAPQKTDDEPRIYTRGPEANGDRPGDDFNRRVSWSEVLTPAGWTHEGTCGQADYWKRPGKTEPGHSAITGNGDDRLCNFSSNASPFEKYGISKKTYSKFQAYAALYHQNDFTAAAKALTAEGYGRLNGQPTNGARNEYNEHPNRDESQGTTSNLRLIIPPSDYTNAVALVKTRGTDLRYCHPAKLWYTWDGTRWLADETATVMRWATDVIKAMAIDLRGMETEQAKTLLAHIKSSLSTSRLKAMVEQASWLPTIPVLPKDLDRDPWLLNCLNGTLDLRTGELLPHRRDDLITMMTAAEYHPEARSQVWERSLLRILPDETDRRYVQKAAGYSLTGLGTEDVLFFPFGPTKTGKSTILKALRATWGDYATTADFETFLTGLKLEKVSYGASWLALCHKKPF